MCVCCLSQSLKNTSNQNFLRPAYCFNKLSVLTKMTVVLKTICICDPNYKTFVSVRILFILLTVNVDGKLGQRNLSKILLDHPISSVNIFVSNTIITSLPVGIFKFLGAQVFVPHQEQNFPHWEWFIYWTQWNRIASISQWSFTGLGRLITLHPSYNRISLLRNKSFIGLGRFQYSWQWQNCVCQQVVFHRTGSSLQTVSSAPIELPFSRMNHSQDSKGLRIYAWEITQLLPLIRDLHWSWQSFEVESKIE